MNKNQTLEIQKSTYTLERETHTIACCEDDEVSGNTHLIVYVIENGIFKHSYHSEILRGKLHIEANRLQNEDMMEINREFIRLNRRSFASAKEVIIF